MSDRAPSFRAANSRLKGGLRPELSAVCYPVPDDRIAPVLAAVHRFDKAHIVMLAEAGIILREDAGQMLQALRTLEADPEGVTAARLRIGGGNHSGEKHLTASLSEAVAGKIHAGRSSGDISAVANRFTEQRLLARCMAHNVALRRAVLARGRADRDIVIMGYSHLQHAQPTTLGHYWASWLAALERDFSRLHDRFSRFDFCPAGAAVLTGSRFPIRPERTAQLLGFSRPFVNSRDAVWAGDSYQEAASVLALALQTCGRIAEDLYLWSSSEFGFVELADGFCINSSILPQKKNPIALEHIRGVAALAVGRLAPLFSIFQAPSDSIVFDRYLATEELWRSFEDAAGAMPLLMALLGDMTIHEDATARVFRGSWYWTSDLAASLTIEHGLPWRTAQQSASVLVRRMIDAGRTPESVVEADVADAIREYSGLTVQLKSGFVDAVRDPKAIVRSRIVPGGPAAADVDRQLAEFSRQIDLNAVALDAIANRHARADAELDNAVSALL